MDPSIFLEFCQIAFPLPGSSDFVTLPITLIAKATVLVV